MKFRNIIFLIIITIIVIIMLFCFETLLTTKISFKKFPNNMFSHAELSLAIIPYVYNEEISSFFKSITGSSSPVLTKLNNFKYYFIILTFFILMFLFLFYTITDVSGGIIFNGVSVFISGIMMFGLTIIYSKIFIFNKIGLDVKNILEKSNISFNNNPSEIFMLFNNNAKIIGIIFTAIGLNFLITGIVLKILWKRKDNKIIKGISEGTELKLPSKSLGDLTIDKIEGMDDRFVLRFNSVKINKIIELQACNPFIIYKDVKLPLYKVMEYKNKAQTLLKLRFDKSLVENLIKRNATIYQALLLKTERLNQFANQDTQKSYVFIQNLTQLSMLLKPYLIKELKIEILKEVVELETDEEKKIVISKEDELKEYKRIISNTKIALLLERMLEGWINELTPRWDLNTKLGYVYPEAEEIIDPNNEIVSNTLQYLYKVGIFERTFFDKIFRCPFCQYPTISLKYSCIRCGSRNLHQEEMIQHYNCGHVDISKKFKTGDKFVCPKCAIELESLGKDFFKPGVMYECKNCGDISGSVYKKMYCSSCNSLLEKDKEILDDIWIYKLNREKRDLLLELLNPKQKIKKLLKTKGFILNSDRIKDGKIKGKSEIEHYFDIFAEKDSSSLLIEFATDENQVEIDPIYDLFAKSKDLEIDYAVFFAFPKASQEAKNFAKHYNIQVIESEDLTGAMTIFKENLDNIFKVKFL